MPPPDIEEQLEALGFDDAARAQLAVYVETLDRWRRKINLVGPTGIDGLWRRHVLDCAQLWPLIDDADKPLLDLGAGAGLPGLVLAIAGATNVTLVDSDQRKAVFLREAARAVGVSVQVTPKRFDAALAGQNGRYHVVTAPAVATVDALLPHVYRALAPGGFALLMKGSKAEKELTEARKSWTMQTASFPSITDSSGAIIKIWGIEPHD